MCIEGPWVFGQGGWAYGFDLAADKAQIYYDPLELVADGEAVFVVDRQSAVKTRSP